MSDYTFSSTGIRSVFCLGREYRESPLVGMVVVLKSEDRRADTLLCKDKTRASIGQTP